jgi:ribonucleoside-diphosphate reductase alpha chain
LAKLSENATKVAESRYFTEGEDWQKLAIRVGNAIASVEKDKEKWSKIFSEIIYDQYFIPAGRILRNAGKQKGSLYNCYVLPIGDSRAEIGQFYKDSLILWGEGGGCGVNLSSLRPKGAEIKGVGGVSSGPISFLIAADSIASTVESGGSRRAAGLACMDVSHPDVLPFIDAKIKHGVLPHFNISVIINDDFLSAVEGDNEWEYRFSQKSYGKVKARVIWNKIMENMITHAEPGLLNWNNFSKNNSYYFDPVISTNPCGEAVLPSYGCCNLGSLVLPNFVANTNTNWKKLEDAIRVGIRLLDDVIEINNYVIPDIDIKAHNSRRCGVGVMGLAEYLFAKKIRYGSERSVAEVDRLMKFIRDVLYDELVNLSLEKGCFPKFDSIPYGKASFIRKLPAALRMKIKECGVRCVTAMAIAPTGTVSLLADTTSGIEPLFKKAYLRSDRVGDRMYVHPLYKSFLIENKPCEDWFVDTDDLKPEDHFEIQSVVQKNVDGAVSKTINMPKDTTVESLSKLMLEYIKDEKGCTLYVDGSREGQILNKLSDMEVLAYLKDNKVSEGIENMACTSGSCEV